MKSPLLGWGTAQCLACKTLSLIPSTVNNKWTKNAKFFLSEEQKRALWRLERWNDLFLLICSCYSPRQSCDSSNSNSERQWLKFWKSEILLTRETIVPRAWKDSLLLFPFIRGTKIDRANKMDKNRMVNFHSHNYTKCKWAKHTKQRLLE